MQTVNERAVVSGYNREILPQPEAHLQHPRPAQHLRRGRPRRGMGDTEGDGVQQVQVDAVRRHEDPGLDSSGRPARRGGLRRGPGPRQSGLRPGHP